MFGRHFTYSADFTREGNHSFSFQWPFRSPHSWPIRTHTVLRPVRFDASPKICSATHFDSAYPVPIATTGSSKGSSLYGAGVCGSVEFYVEIISAVQDGSTNVRLKTPIELTKRICGGFSNGEESAKLTRLRTPKRLFSKDLRVRLKSTGQAIATPSCK